MEGTDRGAVVDLFICLQYSTQLIAGGCSASSARTSAHQSGLSEPEQGPKTDCMLCVEKCWSKRTVSS